MTETEGLTTAMRQVEPSTIEAELDNDWRVANARALAGGGQAAARTSVLTLVIYSDTDAQAQRALAAVRALTNQSPSRCVVIAPLQDGEKSKPLEAYIQTRAEGMGGNMSYGEEIVLRATPSASEHLAGAILPLILSGLPAFLWWQGEPPWHTPLFEATIDGFDRLLVDTCEMRRSDQALVSLDDVVRRKKASCAITNFSFARLNPWRELVAQFFDSSELLPYLYNIDRLSIEYAAGEFNQHSNASQAYLFAGWLASRLDWTIVGGAPSQLVEGGRDHTLRDLSGRKIALEISPRYGTPLVPWLDLSQHDPDGQAVGPGALMSVYLRSQINGSAATFSVARETQDLRHVSTSCQAPQVSMPSHTIHMPSLGESASLGAELQRVGHDVVFEESLALAAQLLGAPARRSL
ncbi:MAG TPA: glucose-6-phosphate dehydrogenase assembly protein OpcA [Ktedonobacterales bacterium]|nr:glucose-6-phosphate dehydrogenase assembly protein OpcA [Ktedonobacterales bacterium]